MSLLKTNIEYAGKDVNLIVRESFKDTLFIKNFGARVIESLKSKYVFYDLSTTASLAAYEKCPSTFGDATLDQRGGDLCSFQFLLEMDKDSLIGTTREYTQRMGFENDNPLDDATFQEALLEIVMGKIAEQHDDLVLNGDTVYGSDYLDICDGLIAKWLLDDSVIDVSNTTVTTSNVLAELNKIYAAVPKQLKSQSRQGGRKGKFAVSQNIFDAYLQVMAQTQSGFNFFSPDKMPVASYLGYEVICLGNLPDDTAFFTYGDNLALFYDDAADFSKLQLWDLEKTGPCDKLQMRVKFRAAVDYGIGSEIVLYS